MLIVGLTGGIGSGKSTVCNMFAKFGVPIIDTDMLARDVVQPGSQGLQQVVELFGPEILRADGDLDRDKLRARVFASEEQRLRLEQILHPLIWAELEKQLAQLNTPYCLIAIPLLLEAGWQEKVDRILVVDCPEEIQIERARQRDKLSTEAVKAIMATQASREQRLAQADDVLLNDGDLHALRHQVGQLHTHYLQLAGH